MSSLKQRIAQLESELAQLKADNSDLLHLDRLDRIRCTALRDGWQSVSIPDLLWMWDLLHSKLTGQPMRNLEAGITLRSASAR